MRRSKDARLVVRRGQAIRWKLSLSRRYNRDGDAISFVFMVKGTSVCIYCEIEIHCRYIHNTLLNIFENQLPSFRTLTYLLCIFFYTRQVESLSDTRMDNFTITVPK